MSTRVSNALSGVEIREPLSVYWALGFLGVGTLAAAYLSILYTVVDVVGGVGAFGIIAVAAVVLGAVFRFIRERTAVLVGAVLLAVGLAIYLLTLPSAQIQYLTPMRLLQDNIALLTGFSVLQMRNVQNWALAVTAGPTFLTAYFAFRAAYRRATIVAGLTLGFFVLTGDSGAGVTMIGVVGAASAVGFGTLARHDGTRHQGEILAGLLGLMVISAGTVTAIPGGGSPLLPEGLVSTSGDLVSADDRVAIGGSLTLSPTVLFTVEADQPDYWRVAAYDRFTGSAWLRTGPRSGPPPPRPGPTHELVQHYTTERPLDVYPAAATPTSVSGLDARISEFGTLEGTTELDSGDRYTVVSERSNATLPTLQTAQGQYPEWVTERYLQIPASTSDQVTELAGQVTANAETPYQKARAVETFLESQKGYSLSVRSPSGNIVNQFLFEMESGYCVYFASSMVTMLRSQGVPARYVTGYTPGQQVAEDRYVVRGLDSHAWVEVYLPDVGWVRFDPTPAGPRAAAERERVTTARTEGVDGVDVEGSESVNFTSDSTFESIERGPTGQLRSNGTFAPQAQIPGLGQADTFNGTVNITVAESDGAAGGEGPRMPPPEVIGLWLVLGVGVITGARRLKATRRLYRFFWLLRMPSGDPRTSVEGAFDRVLYVLERIHRDRQPGETVREYVLAVTGDDRVHSLLRLRERAVYAGRVDDRAAESARNLAREVLADNAAAYRFFPSTVFNRLLS